MTTPVRLSGTSQAKKASVAGLFGGMLEYYDQYIYAQAAALVFGRIFFPDAGATGGLLALATFGVGYAARPLGGFLAGHLADRVGRRFVLLATLLLMGVATFVIGCLPTYSAVGLLAPILLVFMRLLQGVSVGGEGSSAATLITEQAPRHRRGLYTSWISDGVWLGYILASVVFILVAALPEDQLLSWGWRIPFLSSAVIVIAGIVIRRTLREPEAFLEKKESQQLAKIPFVEVFRERPVAVFRGIFASFLLVIGTVAGVYGLSYGTSVAHLPATVLIGAILVGYIGALITQPLFGWLSDRIGRRPVLILGNVVGVFASFQFFWAIADRNIPMIYVGSILVLAVSFGALNSVYLVYFAEQFDVRLRVSGMAITIQLGIVFAGFAPTIISAMSQALDDAWWPAAAICAASCVISAIAVLFSRETAHADLESLEKPVDA